MIEKLNPQVARITLPSYKNFEQWFLLTGDRHWDNVKSDWNLQIKHLQEVVKRKAYIIDIGDFFCLMQGKYDKRSSKSDLREEHKKTNYLDAVISTGVDFFAPYSKHFLMISPGNHETAILKKHEINITERFVAGLNYKTGSHVKVGTYSGWIIFRFKNKLVNVKDFYLKYTHGYGGGGPVTKGVIQAQRRSVYVPDAHIVISAHIHERWLMEIRRERINSAGDTYLDEQIHVCIPTYKEEFLQGDGWHIETGKPPKPIGAWWLRFYFDKEMKFEFTRAK